MRSVKIICGGIGFLVFAICGILLVNMSNWDFMNVPTMISLLVGIIMVIIGLFIDN